MSHSSDDPNADIVPPGTSRAGPEDETILHDAPVSAPVGGVPEEGLSIELTESITGRDELLARLIVERGFASREEVDDCLKRTHGIRLGRRRTFDQWLVERQVLTPRQLERLAARVEADKAGRTVPGYTVLGLVGRGAVATVYKARQLNLDRIVAIKVLSPRALRSQRAIEAFYAEGRAAAKLNHPNIVQAYDVGRAGDVHYFVMEFVEGPTVHQALEAEGPIDEERSLEVVIAVAEALAHAHERGLVHRDVKPKNIILAHGEGGSFEPKLADLGLARVIEDRAAQLADYGRTLGTPFYISPEQVRGDMVIGPASDIYSLGATWYQMVTGRPPFTGKDSKEVMDKHLHEALVPAERVNERLDLGLCEIMSHMLAKDPKHRIADCRALLAELRAWRSVFTLRKGEASARGNTPASPPVRPSP